MDLAPISQRTSALGQWATALCSRDSRDSLGKLSQFKIGSFNQKKHLQPHILLLEFTLRQYTCTEQTVLLKEFRVTRDHDVHVYKIITKYSYLIFQYFFTLSHDFSQSKLPWARYSSCLDRLTKHVQKWPGHIHKPHGQHTEKSNSWINSNEVIFFQKVHTCCWDTFT